MSVSETLLLYMNATVMTTLKVIISIIYVYMSVKLFRCT